MARPTKPAAHRKTRRSGGTTLTGASLVVGLWFGLTAPSVSPVASPTPAVQTVAQSVVAPAGDPSGR